MLERISYEWKHTALTHSKDAVRHTVTLKWLPIVFVRLVQSQRIVKATIWRLRIYRIFSPLIRNLL
jgi:hypothetical protein